MTKNNVLYPIFLECCAFTDNIFWINIFENLSYGKTSHGIYITKNHFLCCSYKNKEFSYKIDDNKDAKTIYNEVYILLTKKVGIHSNQEKQINKNVFYENYNNNTKLNWTNIKKKNIKDILLEQYILEKKKLYNLTLDQSKFLYTIINFSLIFKILNTSNIIFDNGKIIDITDIKLSENKIDIYPNIFISQKATLFSIYTKKKSFRELWTKYIEYINKLYI